MGGKEGFVWSSKPSKEANEAAWRELIRKGLKLPPVFAMGLQSSWRVGAEGAQSACLPGVPAATPVEG